MKSGGSVLPWLFAFIAERFYNQSADAKRSHLQGLYYLLNALLRNAVPEMPFFVSAEGKRHGKASYVSKYIYGSDPHNAV